MVFSLTGTKLQKVSGNVDIYWYLGLCWDIQFQWFLYQYKPYYQSSYTVLGNTPRDHFCKVKDKKRL